MTLVIIYLAAIVAANLTVATFGPASTMVNAFLLIGLDLTCRDRLHERWHGKRLRRNMALLIAAGSVLTVVLSLNAAQIALASFVAFALAAVADTLIYALLARCGWFVRVNGSNVVGAAVDSVVFPAIAFGFPLLWFVMLGQFAAKVFGGFLWSLVLRR